MVKHRVVKRPVVKHAVVKKHPAPPPKPQPVQPQVRLAPTEALPVSGKGSSSALPSILWVLLEIAGALALIAFLQQRRAIPALSRLYHGAEADAGGGVAVARPQSKVARPRRKAAVDTHAGATEPQPKVARPRRKAEANNDVKAPLARPQSKVARPRPKAEDDTEENVTLTEPVRHVVAVSRVPRPHRKAEADADAPVLPTRTRRRLPGVALPKIHRTHPEPEAEEDADPEAAVYARSYLEWLERH